jgi:hypothetical protein
MMTLGTSDFDYINGAITDFARNLIDNPYVGAAVRAGEGFFGGKVSSFQFAVTTAAYNELSESHSWNWAEQNRMNSSSSLQYTGKPQDTITLEGSIAPAFKYVGIQQMKKLVALADNAEPLILTSAYGAVFGMFVILGVDVNHSRFVTGGLARYQTFTVELKHYDDISFPASNILTAPFDRVRDFL